MLRRLLANTPRPCARLPPRTLQKQFCHSRCPQRTPTSGLGRAQRVWTYGKGFAESPAGLHE